MNFDGGIETATLIGTPDSETGGIYELVFVASNSVGSIEQHFTLIVQTIEDIGAEGGTITSYDGDIVITIPVDAVTGNTTFTFIPQAEPTPDPESFGTFMFAGISFTLTAEDSDGNPIYTFTEPLIITITYDPDALDGIDPDTLRLYYWDGTNWEDAICEGAEYTPNMDENWFSLPICHLSQFAVLGKEIIEDPGYKIFLPLILG